MDPFCFASNKVHASGFLAPLIKEIDVYWDSEARIRYGVTPLFAAVITDPA